MDREGAKGKHEVNKLSPQSTKIRSKITWKLIERKGRLLDIPSSDLRACISVVELQKLAKAAYTQIMKDHHPDLAEGRKQRNMSSSSGYSYWWSARCFKGKRVPGRWVSASGGRQKRRIGERRKAERAQNGYDFFRVLKEMPSSLYPPPGFVVSEALPLDMTTWDCGGNDYQIEQMWE